MAVQFPRQLTPLLRTKASASTSELDRQQRADEMQRGLAGQVVRESLRAVPGRGFAVLPAADDGIRVFHDSVEAVARTETGDPAFHLPETSV